MPIQLNKNDKRALIIFAVFISLFLIFEFIISPFSNGIEKNNQVLISKTNEYNEIVKLRDEYKSLGRKSNVSSKQLSKRARDFTLYDFLDKLTETVGLKDNVDKIQPSTKKGKKNSGIVKSIVEMNFQNITMSSLSSYLYKVETSKNMVEVVMLSISKKNIKSDFINVVVKFETVKT